MLWLKRSIRTPAWSARRRRRRSAGIQQGVGPLGMPAPGNFAGLVLQALQRGIVGHRVCFDRFQLWSLWGRQGNGTDDICGWISATDTNGVSIDRIYPWSPHRGQERKTQPARDGCEDSHEDFAGTFADGHLGFRHDACIFLAYLPRMNFPSTTYKNSSVSSIRLKQSTAATVKSQRESALKNDLWWQCQPGMLGQVTRSGHVPALLGRARNICLRPLCHE